MKNLLLFFALSISVFLLSSCKSQQKALGYIENYTDTTKKDEVKYVEPLIQKNDLLFIYVYSDATDGGKADAIYNLSNLVGSTPGGGNQGFLVDNNGDIQYPRIGVIKAEGLTKPQLAEIIKTKINQPDIVLKNPTVIIRLLNFRITMLGEVSKPGPITLPGEKVTILEAIGLAGDLSIYGKKDDIVIIREIDSKITYGKIDLSSRSIFESPYFYLRQNDVVLINPNKNKARLNDQVFNQRMGMTFSIINMIALLYNIFRH